MVRLASIAQGNKQSSDEQKELQKEAADPYLKETWDNQAWGVVLEHLDRQMLEPGGIGTPKQVKEKLRDLFKAYASYKGQLVALLPKKGQHEEEVPGYIFRCC